VEREVGEKGFLEGLRVLDLADEKGSFCSKLLADMGARVIKVEKPGGTLRAGSGRFSRRLPIPRKVFFSIVTTRTSWGSPLISNRWKVGKYF